MFIYSLSSSSDPENIRYIGKTKNLKDRLRRHTSKYYLNLEINHKNNWIKSELLKDNKILINVIESVNEENWQEREKYWISKFISDGFKLTNSTEGGDGIILTQEIIEKRSQTRINNTKEKNKEIFEKFNIRFEDGFWKAERICECGSMVKYSNVKKYLIIANIKRSQSEKRACLHCKSIGEKNHFFGKKLNDGKLKQEKYGKKILQFDLENNFINEFNSIREASEKTGVDRKSISNCAKGVKHYNTAGGFKFKIKE